MSDTIESLRAELDEAHKILREYQGESIRWFKQHNELTKAEEVANELLKGYHRESVRWVQLNNELKDRVFSLESSCETFCRDAEEFAAKGVALMTENTRLRQILADCVHDCGENLFVGTSSCAICYAAEHVAYLEKGIVKEDEA